MPDHSEVARLRDALVSVAGGYLHNPVRQSHVTCADCLTPVADFERCYTCKSHRAHYGLSDATAFLTYAVAGQKSGYMMREYKAQPAIAEHRTVVGLLLLLALCEHTICASAAAGLPVTHWAIVPSLPAKPGEHPLRSLVINHTPGQEVRVAAADGTQRPRDINPAHFTCTARLPSGSHALLIDDTWVTGGHAQSAALALRNAGTAKVSVLVVARWIKADFADNKKFIGDLASHDYDPRICPWTSGLCGSA